MEQEQVALQNPAIMKNIILVIFSLFLGFGLQAQVSEEVFESFKLQERRKIKYYIPENYDETKKYPLVVVLDGEYLYDQVLAVSKYYSEFHGMPESIVLGIFQKEDDNRWKDCAYDEDSGLPTEQGSAFFEFLGMEVIAFIATTYNVAPFKIFVGYDITANFGNYYLFKDRSLFDAFISISPYLAPEMESRIPQRLSETDQKIFYHLIVEGEKSKNRSQIMDLHKNLSTINRENIQYYFDEYPEADQTSVVAYGFGKAWDTTFKIFKPISPKEYKEEILSSEEPVFTYLENKYDAIEQLFGFRKSVELNDIMAIYAASRKKEDFESLKPLSDLCKREFPDSMLGFYFEGEYYEQMGEPKKAMRTFEKAFQMEEIDFLTKDMALDKIDAIKADFGY